MLNGKLIAVSGPPGSGKTTLTLKIAQEIHERTKKKVIYLSPDLQIPAIGHIFPKREKGSLYSLGVALEKVNFANSDILGVIATTKAMPNMGYLGYIPGDNQHTYAELQPEKVMQMFDLLRDNFDYILVDCDRNANDLISHVARSLCNQIIQVINPDIKSIAYYSSHPMKEGAIQVLNIMDNDLYLPIQDTKTHFPGIGYMVLYSRAVKGQMVEGELMDLLKDPIYRKALKPIVDQIVKEPKAEEEPKTRGKTKNKRRKQSDNNLA